jgi:hypothetical protein
MRHDVNPRRTEQRPMTRLRRVAGLAVALLALVGLRMLPAADDAKAAKPIAKPSSEYLRLVVNEKKTPTSMESAIVHLAAKDRKAVDWTVDLVAAVHIAEKSYYDELNRCFDNYDVVLFELVAPKGTRIAKGSKAKNNNPLTIMQTFMKGQLGLEFQLELIDYTKPNMIHADMSGEELSAAMAKRGDSVWTIVGRMIAYSMSQSDESEGLSDAKLIAAMFNKNRTLAMKRVMAEQFRDMDGAINAIEGPNGSAIVADRNHVVLEAVREQVAAGKKKIAIFYGAGHMADLQKHLRSEYGLAPTSTRWLAAWDMKDPPATPAQKPSQKPSQKPAVKPTAPAKPAAKP